MSVDTAVGRSEKATLMVGGEIFKHKRGGIGFEPLTCIVLKLTRFLVNLQYSLHECLKSLYTSGKNL